MKSKPNNRTLFTLLTRYNLLFMLALMLIAAGVYELSAWKMDSMLKDPNVEELLKSKELYEGEYSRIPVYSLLGNSGAIAILDKDSTVLYCSSEDFDAVFSPGELSCISEFSSYIYVSALEYTSEDGKKQYFVTRDSYNNDGSATVKIMILDEHLKILSGGWDEGRIAYSKREFELLTGNTPENFDLQKYTFSDKDDNTRILLIRTPKWSEPLYEKAYAASRRTWLLIIPLFLAATAGFVAWLDRKIKKPLERLDKAIVGLTRDNSSETINCGGPREIRKIGESFDKMAAQLKESEMERKQLDEGRQKLIADISHDLKTPITVISGYTRAICDQKIPQEEIPVYLNVIDGKVTALTDLIDTFHEFSKVEHPKFALSCQRIEICEFLRIYLAEKYDEINLVGFNLEVSIPETEFYCCLDRFHFKRALDNIINNALRHNRLGTILFIDLIPAKEKVLLRIADNGVGIPLSMKEKIFEPFVMGDKSRSGGGSGLGLSITKKIVEEHNGSIRLVVPSSAERSTEFEIELPLMKHEV